MKNDILWINPPPHIQDIGIFMVFYPLKIILIIAIIELGHWLVSTREI
jgi:hypothetical protein